MTSLHSFNSSKWKEVAPGVEFSVLRAHEADGAAGGGGVTMFVRMAKGAHAPMHGHAGGEETYLISGKLRVGDIELTPGDYLWTPPGAEHDGDALEDTVFFVVLPAGLQVV